MTLYRRNRESLCRACILEEDSGARFEGDDRADWEPRPVWNERPLTDDDLYRLDPVAAFFGEYYSIYRGPKTACDYKAEGCCMSDANQMEVAR